MVSTVDTTTEETTLHAAVHRKIVYAWNKHWVFYIDAEQPNGNIRYRSSSDGSSWSAKQNISDFPDGFGSGFGLAHTYTKYGNLNTTNQTLFLCRTNDGMADPVIGQYYYESSSGVLTGPTRYSDPEYGQLSYVGSSIGGGYCNVGAFLPSYTDSEGATHEGFPLYAYNMFDRCYYTGGDKSMQWHAFGPLLGFPQLNGQYGAFVWDCRHSPFWAGALNYRLDLPKSFDYETGGSWHSTFSRGVHDYKHGTPLPVKLPNGLPGFAVLMVYVHGVLRSNQMWQDYSPSGLWAGCPEIVTWEEDTDEVWANLYYSERPDWSTRYGHKYLNRQYIAFEQDLKHFMYPPNPWGPNVSWKYYGARETPVRSLHVLEPTTYPGYFGESYAPDNPCFSVISMFPEDEPVHLVYVEKDTYDIYHCIRHSAFEYFRDPVQILQVATNTDSATNVTLTKDGTLVWLFWTEPASGNIWSLKYHPSQGWYDKTTEVSGETNPQDLHSFYAASLNNKIGLAWRAGSSSPWNIRYEVVTTPGG